MTRPLRLSSLSSIIGGLAFPFALLLHPTHATNTSYSFMHVIISIALVLVLLGLPGVYLRQKTQMKKAGRIAFFITVTGMVLQIGYILVDGFLAPTFASSAIFAAMPTVDVHVLFLRSIGTLALLVLASEIVFVGGYLLFGVQIVQAHVLPQWTGLFLLSGGVLFGFQIILPVFIADLGAALLGLAFLEMGYILLFKAEK